MSRKLNSLLLAAITVAFAAFAHRVVAEKIEVKANRGSHTHRVNCDDSLSIDVTDPANTPRDQVLCEGGFITWHDSTMGESFTVDFSEDDASPFPNQSSLNSDSAGNATNSSAASSAGPNGIMSYKYTLSVQNHKKRDPHIIVLGKGKGGNPPKI